MPKPDQNVSSSAALQRPQRQKALPKPVAKNIETDLESTTQSVAPEVVETDISEETSSNLPQLSIEPTEAKAETANSSNPNAIESKPEPKKVISIGIGAVEEKTKPKLKPKPKTLAEPTASEQDVSVPPISLDILAESTEQSLTENADRVAAPIKQPTGNECSANDEVSAERDLDVVIEIESIEIESTDSARDTENTETYDETLESDLSESPESSLESDRSQVTEPVVPIFWYQAVGLVSAKYVPSSEAFHKGELTADSGFTYKAYVLSKAVKSLEKKIDLSLPHHFVVYPKTSKLHGVRFEILATDIYSKIEEFKDGEFNIRGLVTKHSEESVLIEIQRRPEYLHPAQYDRFSLEVRGNIPAEMMQQFICLKCQLTENYLSLASYEHLACPITPKLTKTEKPILKPKAQKIEPV